MICRCLDYIYLENLKRIYIETIRINKVLARFLDKEYRIQLPTSN